VAITGPEEEEGGKKEPHLCLLQSKRGSGEFTENPDLRCSVSTLQFLTQGYLGAAFGEQNTEKSHIHKYKRSKLYFN